MRADRFSVDGCSQSTVEILYGEPAPETGDHEMLAGNTEWNSVLEQKIRNAFRDLLAWLWPPPDDKRKLIDHDRLTANPLTQRDCIRGKLKPGWPGWN